MGNEVKNYNYVDRSKFRINLDPGLTLSIFRVADRVFQGRSQNNKVYQCSCGAIFLVPIESVDKVPKDSDGNLLCSQCGKYSFRITGGSYLDVKSVKAVQKEMDRLFNQAMKQNFLTLALYCRVMMYLFSKEIFSIRDSIDNFQEVMYRMEVLEYIGRFGIVPIVWSQHSHETKIGLKLLQYCQLVELSRIYHVLHDLVLVTLNKIRLEDANGFSPSGFLQFASLSEVIHHPLSLVNRIVYDEDYAIPLHEQEAYKLQVYGRGRQKNFGRRSPTLASVQALTRLCDNYSVSLADHVKFFYDNELRNAFAHSQYEIKSGHIHLTRYGRKIQTQHFEKMLERYQVLFQLLFSKLWEINDITLTTYRRGTSAKKLAQMCAQPMLFTVDV